LDFEYHYTKEQSKFRSEVKEWLDFNIPSDIDGLEEYTSVDYVSWERFQSIRKKIGQKGWLAPSEKREFGGAGLSPENVLVLVEELGKRGLQWILEGGVSSLRDALHSYGREDQKDIYLESMAAGDMTVWHHALEPGVSIARNDSIVRAYLSGDDYILSGTDIFAGYGFGPDYIWVLAITDPDGSIEQTASFLVPARSDGIRLESKDSLVEGDFHTVTFDDVWVPSHCLIGEDGYGWDIMQATLFSYSSVEYPMAKDRDVSDLIKYAFEHHKHGEALIHQSFFQQLLMEVYSNSELIRILKVRNAWLADTGQKITYEASQVALLEKKAALRLSQVARDIMGMYALLDGKDSSSSFNGKFHMQQRRSIAMQNTSAGPEVQSEAIARQLGLGLQGK
jgi:alkylation response protein AidB-like acyl-CoA dehydrogenase